MNEKQRPVGISTLATAFHLSERQVRNLIKAGVLPGPSEMSGRRPLYNYWPVHHAFIEYMAQRRGPASIEEKKAENLDKRNNKLDLEIQEKKQELVNAAEVTGELFKFNTAVKTVIRSIAHKCALEIAHLKLSKKKSERALTAEIQKILSKEHDEALKGLSKWKPSK